MRRSNVLSLPLQLVFPGSNPATGSVERITKTVLKVDIVTYLEEIKENIKTCKNIKLTYIFLLIKLNYFIFI
jgi:hypothetical protein